MKKFEVVSTDPCPVVVVFCRTVLHSSMILCFVAEQGFQPGMF